MSPREPWGIFQVKVFPYASGVPDPSGAWKHQLTHRYLPGPMLPEGK